MKNNEPTKGPLESTCQSQELKNAINVAREQLVILGEENKILAKKNECQDLKNYLLELQLLFQMLEKQFSADSYFFFKSQDINNKHPKLIKSCIFQYNDQTLHKTKQNLNKLPKYLNELYKKNHDWQKEILQVLILYSETLKLTDHILNLHLVQITKPNKPSLIIESIPQPLVLRILQSIIQDVDEDIESYSLEVFELLSLAIKMLREDYYLDHSSYAQKNLKLPVDFKVISEIINIATEDIKKLCPEYSRESIKNILKKLPLSFATQETIQLKESIETSLIQEGFKNFAHKEKGVFNKLEPENIQLKLNELIEKNQSTPKSYKFILEILSFTVGSMSLPDKKEALAKYKIGIEKDSINSMMKAVKDETASTKMLHDLAKSYKRTSLDNATKEKYLQLEKSDKYHAKLIEFESSINTEDPQDSIIKMVGEIL